MEPPLRTTLRIAVVPAPPLAEARLSAEQAAAAAGITTGVLARLVRAGLIESATAEGGEFSAEAVSRLRRMLRLRRDLGVNLAGAAIILDLLERIEHLEAELARLRQG